MIPAAAHAFPKQVQTQSDTMRFTTITARYRWRKHRYKGVIVLRSGFCTNLQAAASLHGIRQQQPLVATNGLVVGHEGHRLSPVVLELNLCDGLPVQYDALSTANKLEAVQHARTGVWVKERE